VGSLIGIYRSRPQIVQAYQDDAGQIRIIGRNGTGLSLEEFQTQFEPARPEDLVTPAATNGHAPTPKLAGFGKKLKIKTPARTERAAPAPAAKSTGGRAKVNEAAWGWAEAEWKKGEISISAIAKKLGCADPTVHYQAKARGWGKRPKAGKPVKATRVEKREESEIAQMSRICDHCEQRVKGDPCPVCGKPR
jgi:hypothetical protein